VLSLLDALRRLWDRGLTTPGVVVAFQRWRVLPLVKRRLHLDEMTPEASVESSRMASATLSTDELLRWVKGTVGKADYTAPIPMHPDQGYMSLVSSKLPFRFCLFFFVSFFFHMVTLSFIIECTLMVVQGLSVF
jgi:hypothetical protein